MEKIEDKKVVGAKTVKSAAGKPGQAYQKVVFFNYISQCNASKVKRSLDRGVDPNCFNEDGNSALHLMADMGCVPVGDVLVNHPKCNINIMTKIGMTPLMNATFNNRRKFLQFLLKHGADPNLSTDKEETALHIAARIGNLSLVFDLVRFGAAVNVTNIFDATPLSIAVIDHLSMVIAKFLLRKGSRISSNRQFPLLLECVLECHNEDQIRVIGILIDAGMDLDIIHPFSKMNCLHIVAISGYLPLARFLLDKGANLEAVDFFGRTPMMSAIQHEQPKLQKLFKHWSKRRLSVTWKSDFENIND